ncbi:MAG: hypothetical protein AAB229_02685 [Candidatus Hydrogenedentota bacterium]
MKMILNRKLASYLLVNIFLMILAPPTWAQGAAAQITGRHRAIITVVKGNVEVKAAGQSTWTKASANREVKTGDKIRTAAGASCKVKVSGQGADLGAFDLGASSEVTVGNLQQVKTTARAFFMLQKAITRDDVGMDLKSGDMRSGFNRAEGRVGNYNVYTPVAVAGVRGTKFELDLDGGAPWYEKLGEGKGQGEELELTATVLEGEVGLTGPNWERTLTTGQQLNARTGQIPGNPSGADSGTLQNIDRSLATSTDQTPPTFGGAVSAAKDGGNVTIMWQPASDDSSTPDRISYDIFAGTSSSAQDFGIPTATTGMNVTSFVLTNLDLNANYFVVVRARDEAGNRDANTKEVSTSVGDNKAPTFNGAVSISRSNGNATVTWEPATDNVTPPAGLLYDLYLATSSEGQSFMEPSATSAAGLTSYTFEGLSAMATYYVVVRARDAAGNRDANTTEVSAGLEVATGTTFDTNAEVSKLITAMFEAYVNEDEATFMQNVNMAFAGTNVNGNALDNSKLQESIRNDFDITTTASFEPSITSLTKYGDDRLGANITWNGRFRYATVDTEQVFSGLRADMIWQINNQPFTLISWGGSSPFGRSVPEDTCVDCEPPPPPPPPTNVCNLSVSSVYGLPTSLDLTGDYQEFGPLSANIYGTCFQNGAKVFWYDQGQGAFVDITTLSNPFVAVSGVFFVSAEELRIDFSRFLAQYYNDDPTSRTLRIYVQNPDGTNTSAAENTFNVSTLPGPLNVTSVSTDRSVMDSPDGTPYNFTVQGYNMVTPISSVQILKSDGVTNEANITVGTINIASPATATNPQTLTFPATVTGGITAGTLYVKVTDQRGQTGTIAFNVSASTNVTWNTNQSLSADFTVAPGNTLNVNSGVSVTTTAGSRIIVQGTMNAGAATFNGVQVEVASGGTAILNGATITNNGAREGLLISGGSANYTNGALSNNNDGVNVSSGSLTMSGTNINSNTAAGIQVNGSATASLTNVSATGNGRGLTNNSTGAVTVSGGSYSSNTTEGILHNSSGSMTIQGGATISGNSPDNVRVSASGNLTINNATLTGSQTGLRIDATAGGTTVQLSSVTINTPSSNGITASAGTVQLNGSNTINGGSGSSIDLNGTASLSTSGASNSITGTGATSAGISTSNGSSGSVSVSSGTTISGTSVGVLVRGSGAINFAGSITGTSSHGMDINSFGASITLTSPNINCSAGRGVYVDNSGGVTITGGTIVSTGSFGVERVSVGTGAIQISSCNLTGTGGHDLTVHDPPNGQNNPNGAQGGYKNFFNSGDRVLSPL